jgi:cytochrome oxidase Cu insertion factor (SCO1/SenC/PrrC family)
LAEQISKTETNLGGPFYLLVIWIISTMSIWALAFYQPETVDKNWLARAQYVCFGTMEDGLPNAGGWLLLTLAPLFFLVSAFVAMGRELNESFYSFLDLKHGKFLAILVLILFVAEASWATGQIAKRLEIKNADYKPKENNRLPENYPQTSDPAHEFELINQNGENISLASLSGKIVILTFAFAHCKTVCPAIINTTTSALSKFPKDKVELLIITLDPWRDTPSSLPSLAKKWHLTSNAQILSGEIEDVNSVIEKYNVYAERNTKDGDITHPPIVYVIAPGNKLAYVFNNPTVGWLTDAAGRIKN